MNESKFLPEIELDAAQLPSRGLAYPEGSKVYYRTYMHGEIRGVSTSTVGIENSIKTAMSGIRTSIGVRSLTLQDGIYIAILRKVSTMSGMKFEIPFMCTACDQKTNGVFTHTDIEFEDIDEQVETLPLYADMSGKEVEISPMTIGDYLDLKEGKYSSIIKGGIVDKAASQAIMIRNMDFSEAYKLVYELSDANDIAMVTELDKLLFHSVKDLKGICRSEVNGSKCGHVNMVKLGGMEALISPFRESKGITGTGIRFRPSPKPESTTD
jgi:hypothetical protein